MRVAIIHNEPLPSRYDTTGESRTVLGVLDAVIKLASHKAQVKMLLKAAVMNYTRFIEKIVKLALGKDRYDS